MAGTGGADDAADPIFLGDIEPFEVLDDVRFAINSIALRNCKMGGINLVGPPPGSVAVRAYLYWQWACLAQPVPGLHDTVRFKQVYPLKAGGNVVGQLVGVTANPCWCPAGVNAFTYRADVTGLVSPTGGGSYGVIVKNGSTVAFGYDDPWAPSLFPPCPAPPEPYFEGAALVVVYHSSCEPNGFVCLYDGPLPNTMFVASPGVSYNLLHPLLPVYEEARWAHATCDGQSGLGYVDAPMVLTLGKTNTFINGGLVAGPGSFYSDSDFNGSAGKPLPQLFDTSGHDVTHYMDPAGVPLTNVTILDPSGTGTDCLISDVNVLFIR
jgi:hypothetical protein